MTTNNTVPYGKPDVGKTHARFDEGRIASVNPRRGSLLYKAVVCSVLEFLMLSAMNVQAGNTLVPRISAFPGGEASLDDPNLFSSTDYEVAAGDTAYLYIGDSFRYYLNGDGKDVWWPISVYLSDRNWVNPVTPQFNMLDISGGAKFGVSTLYHKGGIWNMSGVENTFNKVIVRDGGVFTVGSYAVEAGGAEILVRDGGHLVVTNMAVLGGKDAGAVTMRVERAYFDVATAWNFGAYAAYNADASRYAELNCATASIYRATVYDANILMKDSQVAFASIVNGQDGGDFNVARNSMVTIDGGSVTGGIWSLGYRWGAQAKGAPNGPGVIRILGGHHGPGMIRMGLESGIEGILEVNGDDAVVDFDLGWNCRFGISAGATGTVRVVKGTFRHRHGTASNIPRFGCTKDAVGRVIVEGGLFDLATDVTHSTVFGESGRGILEVSGGTAKFVGLTIGYSGNAYSECEMKQTGGLVELLGNGANDRAVWVGQPGIVTLDGGELRTKMISAAAGLSKAEFSADGGRITVNAANGAAFFTNFTKVELGDGGLVFDTAGYDASMANSLANKTDEDGIFIKTGTGTLNFSGNSTVSKTIINGGTFALSSASATLATALVVTDGAAFSLVGDSTGVTLDSLSLTNGLIRLDPTDTITVNGVTSLSGLKVELSSLPAAETEVTLLVVDGEADAATVSAWRRAVAANEITAGKHAAFIADYDAGTGKTLLKFAVKADTPLTDSVVWTGSGAWNTDSNWTPAQAPTLEKTASFTGTPVSTEVTLGTTSSAGALAFSGNNYTLSGGKLGLESEQGAARIDVAAESTNTIASPITAAAKIMAAVDGSIALNGAFEGGGIDKSGSGCLTLGAANAFNRELLMHSGQLAFTAEGALRTEIGEFKHIGGQVEFTAEDSIPLTYRSMPPSGTDMTVINNSADVTLEKWSQEGGRFMKRGAGTLTIPLKATAAPVFRTGGAASANSYIIPDDGSLPYRMANGVPTTYPDLGGLTVAEGRLEFDGTDADGQVSCTGARTFVGLSSLSGTAEAELSLKNINILFNNDAALELGQLSNEGSAFSTHPTLSMNNSTSKWNNVRVGVWCYGKRSHPTVALTNSWLQAGSQMKLAEGNGYSNGKNWNERSYAVYAVKDSRLSAGINCSGWTWFGGMIGDFDHTVFNRADGASDALSNLGQYTYGSMTFRNGSVFAVKSLGSSGALKYDTSFIFDDSSWRPGEDITFDSENLNTYMHVVSTNGGFKADVAANCTMYFKAIPLTGNGGVKNIGAGTVKFASGMYQATGKIVAEAGVIDFSDAGVIDNTVIGAGAGTILGGTFNNAAIELADWTGTSVPNFSNCTFTGKTKVVVRAPVTDPLPKDVLVANLSDSTFEMLRLYDANGGKLNGEFTIDAATVHVSISTKRLMIILR